MAKDCPTLMFDTACSRSPRGVIEYLVARGLEDRLVYGSDMPFLDPGGQLGKVVFADIDAAAQTKIIGGNALKLLGWR